MKVIQTLHARKSLLSFSGAALLAVTAAGAQLAGTVPGDTGIDSSGRYQQEVQACRNGQTQQDQDTCLREARNAQAERQRGTLSDDPVSRSNAIARCNVFQGEDKAACEARVLGYGSASGSVAGGGVLREVETVVVPPGTSEITIEPKTADPVVLVPATPGASK